jgi:hypothetical protein
MKICKHCNIEKPLSDFVKTKLTLDGTISTCKLCANKKVRDRNFCVSLKEKSCCQCNKTKLAEEFPKNKQLPGGLHSWCKECSNKKNKEKEYYKNSQQVRKERRKNDPEFRAKINKQKQESRLRNISSVLLGECKRRALKKGLEFDLTIEDIVIPNMCPILLQPIEQGNKDNYKFSPSVDRIDNTKGYIKGNVQIISMKANTIKNSATIEELILFAEWVNKTFKKL